MATLEELTARRDGLIKRVSSLTSRVSVGDRDVQYDLTQAKTALTILDAEIATAKAAASPRRPVRAVRVFTRSGF